MVEAYVSAVSFYVIGKISKSTFYKMENKIEKIEGKKQKRETIKKWKEGNRRGQIYKMHKRNKM